MVDPSLLCAPFAHARGDVVVDWLGNKWPEGSFPRLPDPATWVSPLTPNLEIGDGFRAGGLEWAALGLAARLALRTGVGGMIEGGASQGPWCLSWIRALPAIWEHADSVRAIGLEAGAGTEAASQFWAAQGLEMDISRRGEDLEMRGPNWHVSWRRAAMVAGGGDVYFPMIDIRRDNGARPEREDPGTDYRGVVVEHERVPGVDLQDVVGELGSVSLLHLDLQGAELELLQGGSLRCLQGTTDVVLLGTHSRIAEQVAFELMPSYGFHLLGDAACQLHAGFGGVQLVVDGEQLWVSERARELAEELSP